MNIASLFLKSSTILQKIIDFIIPHCCGGCNQTVEKSGLFCTDCWQKIKFIEHKSCCHTCGYPLRVEIPDDINSQSLCGMCVLHKPIFTKIRSVCEYNSVAQKLLVNFKYNDGLWLIRHILHALNKLFTEEFQCIDIICCPPMDKASLRKRTYNQAAIIAKCIAKQNTLFLPDLLIKTKKTAKQSTLSKEQRQRNLKGSMAINPKYLTILLKHSKILIVDDIITTSATLEECAKTIIKQHRQAELYGISFARTVIMN
jgi:predicted amidophosphoribosyltransferase